MMMRMMMMTPVALLLAPRMMTLTLAPVAPAWELRGVKEGVARRRGWSWRLLAWLMAWRTAWVVLLLLL